MDCITPTVYLLLQVNDIVWKTEYAHSFIVLQLIGYIAISTAHRQHDRHWRDNQWPSHYHNAMLIPCW